MQKTQKELTKDIARRTVEHVCKMIDEGKIPESWDGFELRWYMNDVMSFGKPDKKRVRDYRNTVIVNGL